MRLLFFGLTSIILCTLPINTCWSKSTRAKITPVAKNIQRLLSTKSCPGCDLSGADLRQSRLTKANLNGANLSSAKLNRADLRGANLQQAILFETDLSGADLSFADLSGAEFRGTILEGAHFKHTQIKGQSINRLIHAELAQLEVYEFAPPKELTMAMETIPAAATAPARVQPAPPAATPPPTTPPAPPAKYAKAAIKAAPQKKQGSIRLIPAKIALAPLKNFTAPAAGRPNPKKIAALKKEQTGQKTKKR